MEKIDFDVIGIAELIKQKKLVVPTNQREYSWEEEQVRSILQDISNAVRTQEKPYFLGTIVLTMGSNDNKDVADGQQRLATTTMILAAFRNWYRAKGMQQMVNAIENDFLFTYDWGSEERIPKLTLNIDDNQFFKENILHPQHDRVKNSPQRRSHKLISQAFAIIEEFVKNFEASGEDYARSVIKDWMSYLRDKSMVVCLIVSNAENAFQMFETLNDRGLKTSQVDLVKNHLFSKSDERLLEGQRLWSSMRSAVESVLDNDDDITLEFLRSACCVINGATTKKEIMKVLKDKSPNKTESIRLLSLLEELSREYAAILNSDHTKWNDYDPSVRKSLHTLSSILGVTQIRPLMLAVAKHFNKKDAATAYKRFVSWSVRFLIRNIRGSRLDDGYARLANKIHNKEIKNANDLIAESKSLVIGDSEFKAAFETARVGTAKVARYYLRCLEQTNNKEPDPEFVPNDEGAINLEHILPEKPDSKSWPKITYQDAEGFCARLGNLALMKALKNNDIGNKSFPEKKKMYTDSAYTLTQQIATAGEEWNPSTIEHRQKFLAELAIKTWSL